MEQIIIQLIAGAVGGNAVGKLAPKLNLGTLGNSVAGIVGGGIGGQLLGMLGAGGMGAAVEAATGAGGFDIGALVQSFAGGGVGGGVLMAVVGLLKSQMNKR
ncbi:MAG: putative membrane protein YeaQ/YmgE (transglycosylase-associated protein family) [Celeribacter sp.]|jgi:hypothetical protein